MHIKDGNYRVNKFKKFLVPSFDGKELRVIVLIGCEFHESLSQNFINFHEQNRILISAIEHSVTRCNMEQRRLLAQFAALDSSWSTGTAK